VASAVARELPFVGLADALALTLLILDREPQRYSRAAARWLGRFSLEATPALSLEDVQLAASALASLSRTDGRDVGAGTLAAI
jgi:hypothetical protein